MALSRIKVSEFVDKQNVGSVGRLPWFHSTSGMNLFEILNERKLTAMPCTVFKGDKLTYFFVGRPAFKYHVDGDPPEWMLPLVFVFEFKKPPMIKRVYPFDSGAFSAKRMPDYIQTFSRERFLLGTSLKTVDKLISYYFEDEKSYIVREPNSEKQLKRKHAIDMRHAEVMALARLYNENTSTDLDDRAATVELQVDHDIALDDGNVIGVIVCQEWLRTPEVERKLARITKNIITYSLYPNTMQGYFGVINEKVMGLYQSLGRIR